MRLKKTYILAAITILLILFAILTFRRIALLQQQIYTIQPGKIDFNSIPQLINSQFNMVYVFLTLTIAIAIFSFIYFAFIEATKEFKFVRETSRKEEETVLEDTEHDKLEEDTPETEKQTKQKEYINNIVQRIKDAAFHKEYSLEKICDNTLSIISKEIEIVQGEIFILDKNQKKKKIYNLISTYAYYLPEEQKESFEYGEGLVGQVAKGKDVLILDNIPEKYIKITSGLGESTPSNLTIIPIAKEDKISIGVIELASFQKIKDKHIELLKTIAEQLAIFLDEKMGFLGFEQADEKEIVKEEATKKTTEKSSTSKETKKTTGSKTSTKQEQNNKEEQPQNKEKGQIAKPAEKNKKAIEKEKQETNNTSEEKNEEKG